MPLLIAPGATAASPSPPPPNPLLPPATTQPPRVGPRVARADALAVQAGAVCPPVSQATSSKAWRVGGLAPHCCRAGLPGCCQLCPPPPVLLEQCCCAVPPHPRAVSLSLLLVLLPGVVLPVGCCKLLGVRWKRQPRLGDDVWQRHLVVRLCQLCYPVLGRRLNVASCS